MPSTQFSFGIRTSSSVKTVHLLGSWDNYHGQLPLSKDKTASKSGSWKGTFRFTTSVLQPGQLYWYYFIIDGYHVSHNPAEESTVEPTTGRSLNILHTDGSRSKSSSTSSSSSSSRSSGSSSSSRSSHTSSSSSSSSKSSSRRKECSVDIPNGRPLSISQIKSPKPISATATARAQQLAKDPDPAAIEALNAQFYATSLDSVDGDYDYGYYENEDFDSMLSSPTSTSSSRSSSGRGSSRGSSVSRFSSPDSTCSSVASCCSCERFGITRKGERVRIDCGGSRCGYDS